MTVSSFVRRTRTGLHALRGAQFRMFWMSQTLSAGGESTVQLALPFATYATDPSPLALGLVLTAYGCARVVALPLGGVVADAVPRRTVMLAAETAKAVTHIGLALVLLLGHAAVWHMVVGAVAYGLAYGLGMPAASGIVPSMVDRAILREANALISLSRNVASIVGFAASGVIVAALSPAASYLTGSALFLGSAAALTVMGATAVVRTTRPSFVRDLVEGWSGLTERRWYWVNLITHGLWNVSYAAFFVVGPVVAVRTLHGAAGWSMLSVAVAVGGLVGAAVALYVASDRPLLHGNLAMGLAALPFAGFLVSAPLPVMVVLVGIAFAGPAFLNVLWAATLQEHVPDHLLSRLSSYDWAISLAALPLGSALAGWSMSAFGVPATVVWALACSLVPAIVAVVDRELRQFAYRAAPAADVVAAG